MQDYAVLFEEEKKKVSRIRRILKSKVSETIMLAAIALIVETRLRQ